MSKATSRRREVARRHNLQARNAPKRAVVRDEGCYARFQRGSGMDGVRRLEPTIGGSQACGTFQDGACHGV
jgi:hypothetical protein